MIGSRSALVFSGGTVHPFESAAPALAEILTAAGFKVRVSLEMPELLEWLRSDRGALLVVYALRWSMTQHEKYDADRPRWGLDLSAAAREAIGGHVRGGGGLLGVHTASICFDTWPAWRDVLGGAWAWGRSHHPPLGPVQTHVNPQHFLARGVEDFEVNDEVYSQLDLTDGLDVFGWAKVASDTLPGTSIGEPVMWTHCYGQGRVVYDALGHDAASLRQPQHLRLLQRSALWASNADPISWQTP